jgi:Zn-dependent oligopeptidase
MFPVSELINLTNKTLEQSQVNYDKILQKSIHDLEILSILANEDNRFITMVQQLGFWQNVSPDEKIRDASKDAEKKLDKYKSNVLKNVDVYTKLSEFYDVHKKQLSPVQKMFMKKILDEFEHNGVLLPETKKNKLKQIEQYLIDLELQFKDNINNNNKTILLTARELEGIPDKYLRSYEMTEQKYIINFKYPMYTQCMKYINNSDVRKLIDYEYNTLCVDENSKILVEILLLRYTRSNILGRKTHAHLLCENLMVKNPDNIKSFLDDLRPNFDSLFLEELRELLKLKEQDSTSQNIPFDNKINPWDITYYFNKLEQSIGDTCEIENYFSLEQVQKIAFNLCTYLFGLIFVRMDNAKVWHPDVKIYSVHDDKTNKQMGLIYFDLFPRNNKYPHMACFSYMPYCEYYDANMIEQEIQEPTIVIVGNFTSEDKKNGIPSLLKHSEMVTYFHEFGHAIHNVCGRVGFSRLSGTSVEHDFVECPSQVLEYWCWEKDILQQFTHWKTGESLSMSLINKLLKTKDIGNGCYYKNQLALAEFDHTVHAFAPFLNKLKDTYRNTDDKSVDNAIKILQCAYKLTYDDIMTSNKIKIDKFSIKLQEQTFSPANWVHMIGYDARYYCYLWNDVFACNIFFTKFKQNIFSMKTGARFRQCILNKGGSMSAYKMIKMFLEESPSMEPFLITRVRIIREFSDNEDCSSETTETISAANNFIIPKIINKKLK